MEAAASEKMCFGSGASKLKMTSVVLTFKDIEDKKHIGCRLLVSTEQRVPVPEGYVVSNLSYARA